MDRPGPSVCTLRRVLATAANHLLLEPQQTWHPVTCELLATAWRVMLWVVLPRSASIDRIVACGLLLATIRGADSSSGRGDYRTLAVVHYIWAIATSSIAVFLPSLLFYGAKVAVALQRSSHEEVRAECVFVISDFNDLRERAQELAGFYARYSRRAEHTPDVDFVLKQLGETPMLADLKKYVGWLGHDPSHIRFRFEHVGRAYFAEIGEGLDVIDAETGRKVVAVARAPAVLAPDVLLSGAVS